MIITKINVGTLYMMEWAVWPITKPWKSTGRKWLPNLLSFGHFNIDQKSRKTIRGLAAFFFRFLVAHTHMSLYNRLTLNAIRGTFISSDLNTQNSLIVNALQNFGWHFNVMWRDFVFLYLFFAYCAVSVFLFLSVFVDRFFFLS